MSEVVLCTSPQDHWPRMLEERFGCAADPLKPRRARLLATGVPLSLPIYPQILRDVLDALSAYLRAILEHAAQNVPRDLDLRQIEALWCDLTSEVAGTLNLLAAALPGRRS